MRLGTGALGQETEAFADPGGQEVTLERQYGVCPGCGRKLFPLAEELELLPGSLTPGLGEILVRLGAWLPFGNAQGLLADWARLNSLREARVRRPTEAAGATYVAIQAAARALEAGWELPGIGGKGSWRRLSIVKSA